MGIKPTSLAFPALASEFITRATWEAKKQVKNQTASLPALKSLQTYREHISACLGNPMDRGAQWVQDHGSQTVRYDLMTKHAVLHCNDIVSLTTFTML